MVVTANIVSCAILLPTVIQKHLCFITQDVIAHFCTHCFTYCNQCFFMCLDLNVYSSRGKCIKCKWFFVTPNAHLHFVPPEIIGFYFIFIVFLKMHLVVFKAHWRQKEILYSIYWSLKHFCSYLYQSEFHVKLVPSVKVNDVKSILR